MSDLAVFSFHESHDVRVILINHAPWFVAADVAAALEYRMASDFTRFLDDDEKGTQIVRTLSGSQEMTVINESGLYSAILKSRKPEAKQFKKWVTSEVLPTIRKTGSYSLPKPVEKREYMTNSDMLNIKRLIYSLTNGMAYKTSCSQAIWHALRQVTGVPSPAKFEVQHIPVVAHELQRIYSALQAYVEVRREVEQELIKRIVRNQEDAQSLLPVLFSLISDTISEESSDVGKQWHRLFGHECQNLLNRVPNNYDHHQFNEQRLIEG
jgi:prophage antirepressor-like protein